MKIKYYNLIDKETGLPLEIEIPDNIILLKEDQQRIQHYAKQCAQRFLISNFYNINTSSNYS